MPERDPSEIEEIKENVRRRTNIDNESFSVLDAGTKIWITIPINEDIDTNNLPSEFEFDGEYPHMNGGVKRFEAKIKEIKS